MQNAPKACINCRRQKMKCVMEDTDRCRRCRRSGLPCVFVPRANAATLPDVMRNWSEDEFKGDVLRRLRIIEERMGLAAVVDDQVVSPAFQTDEPEFSSLGALWDAVVVLQRTAPSTLPRSIWRKSTVKDLWLSFHDRMPGLHFMPRKQTFSAPQPLLVASILFCSSVRGPQEVAELAPHYLQVLFHAIAQLSIPGSEVGKVPGDPEEWAFQTVLGLILAGLLTEAIHRETGIWISIAYRLILENCPAQIDETSREWRKLFSGLQIIDLEHASLHLSCPIIPIECPLRGLQTSNRDQLYRLSRMMHTGLTHFTGRGLPTVWSCFTDPEPRPALLMSNFTAVDAAVIRDWARQLDEWLVEFSHSAEGSEQDLKVVFRQYVLHRLVVLSIYHPARGCDLWSNSTTPQEQQELLLSARATLKLHSHDNTIWSNWDQVMITWASLIVIQGVEGGAGEPDDLHNIKIHIDKLKQAIGPQPRLGDKLVARLETSLANVHTPGSDGPQGLVQNPYIGDAVDRSWHIFDEASLQSMINSNWMV
ncbi:hypothetical protein BO70DRAFT_368173 [Aspergillus heteromorphus CBS 117.55]|uniref:Zn(2)-C6 fungal-type domain-containing protein n=1 Tax=Aspergillus heteromorphus CBS 117.55 TaxID=1448321 RepID=A0A317X1W8_9EURO|nr:uncharacterized protein BO70DRAFT_368173 [Aspergillus heteromorphus CBS 117.55]PWY90978.1 hypothetical protein BO70DRAFT_368173 [Aspergillus heteromorphus CBS 117.55]